jgi:RimJ/RimL family protein N-acetyltransferase
MSIKLRKIKKSDLKYFLKWWKDKELIKLTSGFFEKSDTVLSDYFLDMLKNIRDYHYIIQIGAKVIGHIAIIHKNVNVFETQIIIGEKTYWGKGFGSQAIKLAVITAFGKYGYKKAYLEVRPDNIRAIRAYESCGFVKKGLKKYLNNKHQPVTLKMILNKIDFKR